ncbi:unnamed protein product [Mesocestoides corti]|uniref:PDZ domain-containing protein n=2 Tax=Mesocestoides corti TaxID=53468 RepID=A0A3P6HNZ5_MESCO|nr:unnamed protein product [Mesocestoides corti]
MKEPTCYTVNLTAEARGFGFSIRGGHERQQTPMFILRIEKGSPAFRNEKMQIGDEVLEINGTATAALTHAQVVRIVKLGGSHIRLKLRRVSTCTYDLSF